MVIIHPSIGFIRLITVWRIFKSNCIEHFTLRRCLVTIFVLSICFLFLVINTIGRILDEVFFPQYRNRPVERPVFIISPPRSGTTFLQRVLAREKDVFFSPKLYQILFPSITICKLIGVLGQLDKLMGSPVHRLFGIMGSRLFGIWKDIHPTACNQPEEDEGLWFFTMLSPAWSMIVPYFKDFRELNILDDWDPSETRKIMIFYENFLKRIQYLRPPGSRLLIKSVMSSGRLGLFSETFPDAQFICIERDPMVTIPSYISMFSAPWAWHSPKVELSAFKTVGQSAIDFHNHLEVQKQQLPTESYMEIGFDTLIASPEEEIVRIHIFLGEVLGDDDLKVLKSAITNQSRKKRGHTYSLDEYGYNSDELRKKLA